MDIEKTNSYMVGDMISSEDMTEEEQKIILGFVVTLESDKGKKYEGVHRIVKITETEITYGFVKSTKVNI
ncbi:hypothetical protein JNL27_14600 [bacterium]|nr:hypothetical protein [bacterium]